jgi:hypothetical protein
LAKIQENREENGQKCFANLKKKTLKGVSVLMAEKKTVNNEIFELCT